MPCFAVSSQTTAVRCMAVLLAGYRSSTFFPGLPPQFTPLLNADLFIERRMAGFAAAVSLSKLSSAAKLVVGDGAAVRTFLRSLCETQMLSRLLQPTRVSICAHFTRFARLCPRRRRLRWLQRGHGDPVSGARCTFS